MITSDNMVPNLGCHSDNFLVVPDDNLDNFLDDNHKVVMVTIRLTTVWQLFVLCDAECINMFWNKDQTRIDNQTAHII